MPARFTRWLRPLLALAVLLAVTAAVLAVLAGLGTQAGWWPFTVGFQVLRWAVRVALFAAALALLAGGAAAVLRRWTALGVASVALAVAAFTAAVPLAQLREVRSVPAIHDITTDFEHPPEFQAILPLRAGARNPPGYDGPAVAEQQRRAYPDIRPARFREPPAQVFATVEEIARIMEWKIAADVPAEGRLEATATTFWFGFKDDVVVRVQPIEGGGTRVDIRSKSRVGGSDTGTNARRVWRFLQALHSRGFTPLD
jgi:uncharacterized protein (DUF1499 family)